MVFPLVEDLVDQTIHDLRRGVAGNFHLSSASLSPTHHTQSSSGSSESVEKQLIQQVPVMEVDEDSSQPTMPFVPSRPTIGANDASNGTSAVPGRQAGYGMLPTKGSGRVTTNPIKPFPRPTPMSVQASGSLGMESTIDASFSQGFSSQEDYHFSYGPLQTQAPYRSQSTSQ